PVPAAGGVRGPPRRGARAARGGNAGGAAAAVPDRPGPGGGTGRAAGVPGPGPRHRGRGADLPGADHRAGGRPEPVRPARPDVPPVHAHRRRGGAGRAAVVRGLTGGADRASADRVAHPVPVALGRTFTLNDTTCTLRSYLTL